MINERSIKLSQEVEELKVSKEKLEEYTRRLQGTVEELEKKNYYLEQESRVLRELVSISVTIHNQLRSFPKISYRYSDVIIS